MNIAPEILERTPLMKPEWLSNYKRIVENSYAPSWTDSTGDRLTHIDLSFVQSFASKLNDSTEHSKNQREPDALIEWLIEKSKTSALIAERLLAVGLDPARDEKSVIERFSDIQPMTRSDLQDRLAEIVPLDAEIERVVVNPTSGTTGRPVQVPNHPSGVGCYDPLILRAMMLAGVEIKKGDQQVAAVQIGYLNRCMTYGTVHSYLEGAGFAKINLNPVEWANEQDADRFFESLQPQLITGEPFSFYKWLENPAAYTPAGFLSTAVQFPADLKKSMIEKFKVPIVDFYSTNETGPIAATIDDDRMYRLSPDIFIEVVDSEFRPVMPGEKGEILISGGRNPMLPLLRYRTGDRARLGFSEVPYLYDMDLRQAVYLHSKDKQIINPVDVTRIIRKLPIKQHRMVQNKDLSTILQIVVFDGFLKDHLVDLRILITGLTGIEPEIEVVDSLPESYQPYVVESL